MDLEKKIAVGVLVGLIAMALAFSIHKEVEASRPVPIQVKIVDVYREIKLGRVNGTTVVEMPDGTRQSLDGRLGKKGETITIYTKP
jgi:hypothetical protein